MASSAPTYLHHHEDVIQAFGYWPRFHDSPVLRFRVNEEGIHLEIEAWEMASEVDEQGYFRLHKRHRIGFHFRGIESQDLDSFIPENILFELAFSSPAERDTVGRFTVTLDSAMGGDLCGSFVAKEGEVLFVTSLPPIDETGQPAEEAA